MKERKTRCCRVEGFPASGCIPNHPDFLPIAFHNKPCPHHFRFLRRLGFILKSLFFDLIPVPDKPIHGCMCHVRALRAVRSPPRGDQHAVGLVDSVVTTRYGVNMNSDFVVSKICIE